MATAFRIHEDIENVLDADQKKDRNHKNAAIISIKNDTKSDKQPLRTTFAILNNVTNDSGRNIAAATALAQKTVRNNNNQHKLAQIYLEENFIIEFPLN